MVITTVQLHTTNPELRLYAGSNPARGVSEIRDGGDLWQWCRLKISLRALPRSSIPQKQFIMIIIIKFLFYRPEHNAKGDPMELNFESFEIQK